MALGVSPRSMGGFSWLLDSVGSVRYQHLGGGDMGIYNIVWGRFDIFKVEGWLVALVMCMGILVSDLC